MTELPSSFIPAGTRIILNWPLDSSNDVLTKPRFFFPKEICLSAIFTIEKSLNWGTWLCMWVCVHMPSKVPWPPEAKQRSHFIRFFRVKGEVKWLLGYQNNSSPTSTPGPATCFKDFSSHFLFGLSKCKVLKWFLKLLISISIYSLFFCRKDFYFYSI